MFSDLSLACGVCQMAEFAQEKKKIREEQHEDRAVRLISKKLRLHRHKLLEMAETQAKSASLPWPSNSRYSCLLLIRQM